MYKPLEQNELLIRADIRSVEFNNEFYFSIDDIAMEIKQDLSKVKSIVLPINEEYIKVATLSEIEKGLIKEPLKEEELSEFNKALLKARNFKDENKK
ncbi:hypothetical protein [Epilithonimonas mollis]|uniref:Uncharacterized protein n=1 Tax=Epilithonimonas mollis TaxID=216903 RepID=A0A1M6MWL9_9FLAO|nr:hypothetical protein [Epilithonimonas mollis]SHJ87875.1 hypothetical protein SAMN05444371_0004 [Epilithonimonas mollis]